MRWYWIDRFTEFVSGSHARGIKNVTLVEEAVDDYCPGFAMLPPTLIIEGMAQVGGILVAEHFGFDKRVVLAKVGKATFHQPARCGDQLRYSVRLDAVQDHGATVSCQSHCGEPFEHLSFLPRQGRCCCGALIEVFRHPGVDRVLVVF